MPDGSTPDLDALRAANPEHWRRASAIRALTLDAVNAANSGHSGMPMGMADVATVLWEKHLKFDAGAPDWPDRDRFVLSAGHGSMLLYSLLWLTGFPGITLDDIKNFRQLGTPLAGHPEYGHVPGIEVTTGPLGQGIATAVGLAIAEAHLAARFGERVVDHRTWVVAGDGCLMEGVSQEAIALAGHLRLNKLIVLFDDNRITIDGSTDLSDSTDQRARFEASGWATMAVDGHDPEAIDRAMTEAKASDRPVMIACRTHIALGSALQDTGKGHGAITDDAMIEATKRAYGWENAPFHVPADLKAEWEATGTRGAAEREAWQGRLDKLGGGKRRDWDRMQAGEAPKRLTATVRALKRQTSETGPKVATRKSSEMVLEVVNPIAPETLGGSADLTGSNNTKTSDLGLFTAGDRAGRYIHYGIREHGMAAAMNGIALHGGLRPYGGTFMCFADYARPSMRLSALMGLPVTYVMTHDSIGLGEDGPTHQPVEHLAMLRATPNLNVFRPADTVETAEAWELALSSDTVPSVLSLTRQGVPTVRREHKSKNLVAQGAYVLAEADGKRMAILLATGSEVSIALEARERLQEDGIGTRVVSMPCWELFERQEEAYRKRVLPAGPVRVAVEAAGRLGWDRWLTGERGRSNKAGFVGMDGFGASGPAEALYAHYGITADAVAKAVRALI